MVVYFPSSDGIDTSRHGVATDPEVESLISRVRTELADLPKIFSESLTADGVTSVYELPVSPVDAASIKVYFDGDEVDEADYLVEESTGKLLFNAVPPVGTVISATGLHFRFFTQEELATICLDSFEMHTKGKTDAYGRRLTVSRMDASELYPLSLLCTVNALYVLATDSSFDIDIQAPDGMMVPRSQRFQHLMGVVAELKDRYHELCALLGVGMYSIEVYTLRRISKRTNRYIPVFKPQEIDDRAKPERVYLPTPTYGSEPLDEGIQLVDLIVRQGDTFSQTITTEVAIPVDAILRAQVRTYPGSPAVGGEFTVTRLGTHEIRLDMSHQNSVYLPPRGVWELQQRYDTPDNPVDPLSSKTIVKGICLSPREVTTSYGQSWWPDVPNVIVTSDAVPVVDFVIAQGSTWNETLQYVDDSGVAIDLTGGTAHMQVRLRYAEEDEGEPLVDLTDGDGITLGDGEFTLYVSAEDTAAIPSGTYLYDLEVTIDGSTERVIQGTWTIKPGVTQ